MIQTTCANANLEARMRDETKLKGNKNKIKLSSFMSYDRFSYSHFAHMFVVGLVAASIIFMLVGLLNEHLCDSLKTQVGMK